MLIAGLIEKIVKFTIILTGYQTIASSLETSEFKFADRYNSVGESIKIIW